MKEVNAIIRRACMYAAQAQCGRLKLAFVSASVNPTAAQHLLEEEGEGMG